MKQIILIAALLSVPTFSAPKSKAKPIDCYELLALTGIEGHFTIHSHDGVQGFSDLVQKARAELLGNFGVFRPKEKISIRWKGPSVPHFIASSGTYDFAKELTPKGFKYNRENHRDELDTVLKVLLQVSMENGRRALVQQTNQKSASETFSQARKAWEAGKNEEAARWIEKTYDIVAKNPPPDQIAKGKNLAVLKTEWQIDKKGNLQWPKSGAPLPISSIAHLARQTFSQGFEISAKGKADINAFYLGLIQTGMEQGAQNFSNDWEQGLRHLEFMKDNPDTLEPLDFDVVDMHFRRILDKSYTEP